MSDCKLPHNDSLGTKLEWLWVNFLYNTFSASAKKNFASNLCETNTESVPKTYHYSMVVPLQLDLVKNFFPSKHQVKNIRQNFHCICANCRNIYNDLRNDTNDGELLPFESLAKLKR